MFAFKLSKATATLENFNPRAEKNGPDKVPAADLKFLVNMGPEALNFFSPTLADFVFDRNGPRDLADGMPLRDPHMVYPLVRDEEMTGATVLVDYGVAKPMEFADVKVNQFRLTPQEGGTTGVSFRVQCKPDEKQAGKLYIMQEQGVTITIVPAELPEMDASRAPKDEFKGKDGKPVKALLDAEA